MDNNNITSEPLSKNQRLTQIINNYEWNGNVNQLMKDFLILELETLLDTHSTQAYWPAIIKQRINQLKGTK